MMRYGYGYNPSTGAFVWLIISAVLAVVGGILLYVLFLSPKREGKYNQFFNWMYDFLSFKKMFIENLLKISYLIAAIYITLASFSAGMPGFFIVLIGGNVLVRVCYEFSLILLIICRNTTEINKKLACKCEEKKEQTTTTAE